MGRLKVVLSIILIMATIKVAITVDERLLVKIDALVSEKVFPNRSQAFQSAVQDKIESVQRSRYLAQLALLDPIEERELAEFGIQSEMIAWPQY